MLTRKTHTALPNGPRCGFTLVELLVVVAVIALLLSLLVPTLQNAAENGRIADVANVLHNLGVAQSYYVTDNRGYMQPYVWFEPWAGYNPLENNWNGYCYDYHNVLGAYLGLGDCMPHLGANATKASYASWSQYRQYQCPSGIGPDVGCPCWVVGTGGYSMLDGRFYPAGANFPVGSFYMQNCWWTSQQPNCNWPDFGPFFPKFTNPARAVLLFEHWAVCMTSNSNAVGQPYDTHYKIGYKGAMGICRNNLYADFHVGTHYCIDGPDTESGGGWCCGSSYIPATYVQRGDEGGCTYSQGGGTMYVGWYGTLDTE